MIAYLLNNNNLVIPKRAEGNGVIGDGLTVIDSTHPDYNKWLPFAQPATPEIESVFGDSIAGGGGNNDNAN